MAPLSVGDIYNPFSPESQLEFSKFRTKLKQLKELGVNAVSTDVWWGVVQRENEGSFDWRYYDEISDAILRAGLKWVPILSFHKCGGNVGDSCNFPIPTWIWQKYVGQAGITTADDLKYVSENGNKSDEVVSVWATKFVLGDYSNFMLAFRKHFSNKAHSIAEVNISLGPAGELRYPSYNSHDPDAGYPGRGRLQAYSQLARESFRAFMTQKRGKSGSLMDPPRRGRAPEAEDFFRMGLEKSSFGKDFFDWYSDSLLTHGKLILTEAVHIFNDFQSSFHGIEIGAKIPGVHWRASIDRSAELAAGLIRTSLEDLNDDSSGHGYHTIISLFRDIQQIPNAPKIVLHFTCLEMSNGDGGPAVGSLAKDLVFQVATEAHRLGVVIKGENALAGRLNESDAWENIRDAVTRAKYEGVTILRMDNLVQNDLAKQKFKELATQNAH